MGDMVHVLFRLSMSTPLWFRFFTINFSWASGFTFTSFFLLAGIMSTIMAKHLSPHLVLAALLAACLCPQALFALSISSLVPTTHPVFISSADTQLRDISRSVVIFGAESPFVVPT